MITNNPSVSLSAAVSNRSSFIELVGVYFAGSEVVLNLCACFLVVLFALKQFEAEGRGNLTRERGLDAGKQRERSIH